MTKIESMSVAEIRARLSSVEIESMLGGLDRFAHQCHAASLALAETKVLPGPVNVARGFLPGIGGQHSWAVLGDPYDPTAVIVDLTAWSYDVTRPDPTPPHLPGRVPRVWVTTGAEGGHRPHGSGSIWEHGAPVCGAGEAIVTQGDLSAEAEAFLSLVAGMNEREGLDVIGWMNLLKSPVGGWPAREIVAAAVATPRLSALVPIDIARMLEAG